MKRILALLTAIIGASITAQAQVPVPTYQWNFNQTNVNSTNYIFPTISNGTVPESPASLQGVLKSVNASGTSVNLLGVPGSGVSGGGFASIPFDRSLVIPGVYNANSYMVRTADDAHAVTNLGVITSFTITCWAKVETNPPSGSFPRIVMFGANGQDAGSAGLNAFGILQYNNYDIQLKIHNVSNPNSGNGMSTATQPLASGATNWVFIAVTYDGTLPSGGTPTGGTNVWFYVGDRVDSFLAPTLAPGLSIIPTNYYATSVNSVAPGSTDSPGFINFNPAQLNGDGTTFGISNVYVSIGNRYNGTGVNSGGGNRAFNGRYDDIRLYANQVLTLAQIEAVRTNAPPLQGGPLTFLQQPLNTTVSEGQGASFTVVASDAANRTYQWYVIPKGVGSVSNAVAGATSPTLETTNLTVAGNDGDKYAVRVHSTDPSSDNGNGVFSSYATAHVLPVSQYTATPGMLKFEFYNANSGTSVGNFLNNPTPNYINSTPDQTLFLSSFDTRTVFPDNSHQNYFGQVSGWITPTVTTNYVFFIRASDQADLQLSSDNTTNNLVQIAVDTANGGQLFEGSELNGTFAGGTYSSPIPLVAGQSYAVLAHVKSSIGQNFLQVAWRTDSGNSDLPANDQNLTDRLQPIPGSVLSTLALPLGSASITQQPVASPSSTVPANSKITFTVGVTAVTNTGSGPLVIQWRKNGLNIPGATGTSHTTRYLLASDNGAKYDAVVSVPGVSNLTTSVTVTVNADTTPPTVLGAAADDSAHAVTVQFSEPVDPVTALDITKYSISGGLSVVSASFAVDTNLVNNPPYDAVKLTTSRQADNTSYTVTVTGVKDTAGNTIAGGNKAKFQSYGFAPGFGKFEYFENEGYSPSFTPFDDSTVNGFVSYLPKFTNSDPDTVVYPRSLEMSPQGSATFRAGGVGRNGLPPGFFGTRMSAIITPTNTANYVFYLVTDDTGILWLSTDDNPTNKHAIAYGASNNGQAQQWSSASSTTDEGTLSSQVTVPGATFWPVVDGNNVPVITLTNGQRYYLEVDQRETAGGSSFSTVNWDNGTGVAPANGTPTVLTGNVIGWRFPQPQINSLVKNGSNVIIAWTNSLSSVSQGAFPWPGVTAPETTAITPSFPSPSLQSTPTLNPTVWTSLTNSSPALIQATNPAQFFRIGDQ
jgi:hypothetical protein